MRPKKHPEGQSAFEFPDMWARKAAEFAVVATPREQALAQAVRHEQQAERRRRRQRNPNLSWKAGNQILAEIGRVIEDRHGGPCDTDDGEVYFKAALPSLVWKAGGFEAEGWQDQLLRWIQVAAPKLNQATARTCIKEAMDRRRLRWSPQELGNILCLSALDRERLRITQIRPVDMSAREFDAYWKAKRARNEKARRIAKGATPREQSVARTEPWIAFGMSKRTYYRKQAAGTLPIMAQTVGTNSWPPDTKYLETVTDQCHVSEPTIPGPARTTRPRLSVGAGGPSPDGKTRAVPTGRAVALPLPKEGVSEHPDLLGDIGEWKQLGAPLVAYDGGILPPAVARAVREARRVRQMTQKAVAHQIGISPPQLANALQGRFGLSRSAATNLLEWLAA